MSAYSIPQQDEFSIRAVLLTERPDSETRFEVFLAVYRHYKESQKPSFRRGVLECLSIEELLDLMDEPTVVLSL